MIYFNEDKHIYTNSEGIEYMSATKFIKQFAKPFEREKKAKSTAKKTKRSIEDVLADWDKAGRDSIEKGLHYHKMKEEELLGSPLVNIENNAHLVVAPHFENDCKVGRSLLLEPGVYPELVVWSDKYQIAGQADYVEITQSGKLNITDYKTSKEIKTEGWQKWDGSTFKMLFPLSHLDDCNFFHYSLQINLYAFLIKQYNRHLELGTLQIEHVKGDFDSETKTFTLNEVIHYEVPDLQKEIRIALDYYKETKNVK